MHDPLISPSPELASAPRVRLLSFVGGRGPARGALCRLASLALCAAARPSPFPLPFPGRLRAEARVPARAPSPSPFPSPAPASAASYRLHRLSPP